jgi:hypothetical protein
MGCLAIDQDVGRTGRIGAEVGPYQFDFTERQRGGGHNVVDARRGQGFSSGLDACTRHIPT